MLRPLLLLLVDPTQLPAKLLNRVAVHKDQYGQHRKLRWTRCSTPMRPSPDKDRLSRCLDRLLAHKPALEHHLTQKWQDLFGATFDVLRYDLTSTCFEGDADAVPN